MKEAVARAKSIFDDLFTINDIIYIIINSFEDKPYDIAGNDISTVKSLITHIQNEDKYTFVSTEDEEFSCTRYIIQASVKDIQTEKLIEEIIWSEIDGRNSLSGCVYWLNPRNNVIFYLYDDRGLDVISNTKENLKQVYLKFNNWILDYDREKIDCTFAL